MKAQVRRSAPSDDIKVKMAAPVLDNINHAPSCAYIWNDPRSPRELAASYENWLGAYTSAANRAWGVYRPAASGKWEIAVYGPPEKGFLRHMLAYFDFFPHTKGPSITLASDSEASLNDWAIVGTDLFGVMQQCKIVGSNVLDPESAEHPTAASR
jgi:hypothetical protein